MSTAIKVENLSKAFWSGAVRIQALDGVSLEVDEGEIFGLLGPNGAGKTTLISILCGLTTRDSGRAEIFGMDVERNLSKVQEVINVVSGFSGVIHAITLEEMLKYYAMLYSIPEPEERIDEVLALVELEDRRAEWVSLFSAGLRQRFFLAKALLNRPRVLFLDEPTVGLDVGMAVKIREMIKRLGREGYTILLTTHNMFEAEALCERIALIHKGRIRVVGTLREIKGAIREEKVIEVSTDSGAELCEKLQGLEGVISCARDGGNVRVVVDDYGRMKNLMAFLAKEGPRVYSIRLVEPTLEEVFLELTGEDHGRR